MVEWLTFLHTLVVRGSNLGPETGYPDWEEFFWFPSVLTGEYRDNALKYATIGAFQIIPSSLITRSFHAV
jgi:hypothetical protein